LAVAEWPSGGRLALAERSSAPIGHVPRLPTLMAATPRSQGPAPRCRLRAEMTIPCRPVIAVAALTTLAAAVLLAALVAAGPAKAAPTARAGTDQVRTASNEFRKGDRVK